MERDLCEQIRREGICPLSDCLDAMAYPECGCDSPLFRKEMRARGFAVLDEEHEEILYRSTGAIVYEYGYTPSWPPGFCVSRSRPICEFSGPDAALLAQEYAEMKMDRSSFVKGNHAQVGIAEACSIKIPASTSGC